MKNFIKLLPIAAISFLISCGEKDKKEGDDAKNKKKKMETGCDCMSLMLEELKKLDDINNTEEISARLEKDFPECDKLVDDLMDKYDTPNEAAAECPAVGEIMKLMKANTPDDSVQEEMMEEETKEE